MTLEFVRTAGDAAALTDTYAEIYAEPPYNGGPLYARDRFLDRTRRQVEWPGFGLLSAIDGDTGELAGFCFALTFEPGEWWRGERPRPHPPCGHPRPLSRHTPEPARQLVPHAGHMRPTRSRTRIGPDSSPGSNEVD